MAHKVEQKTLAKAWGYLSFRPVAKWTSLTAAMTTAVLYVVLLVILGLYADLIVYRGKVPSYLELSSAGQAQFQHDWQLASRDERGRRLHDIGLDEPLVRDLKLLGPDPKTAAAEENESFWRGIATDDHALLWRAQVCWLMRERVGSAASVRLMPSFRELPARIQAQLLQQWTPSIVKDMLSQAGVAPTWYDKIDLPPARWSDPQRELAWRAFCYQTLEGHPNRTFVAALRKRVHILGAPGGPADEENFADNWQDTTLADHGILSAIVRASTQDRMPDRFHAVLLGELARWNTWMWQRGNTAYLTGLLAAALGLMLLRGILMFVQQETAAVATIEAATRLRRAVYHHTFRLGMLVIRELGPGEALSVFARHVEAVHEALHARLTVSYREPVKFGLLLLLALLIHFWLTLAFLLFVVLVWVAGAQVTIFFKRRARKAGKEALEQITLLRESLMLMRLVKVYLMELFNQTRVERQLARYASAQQKRFRSEAVYQPLLLLLSMAATVVLLFGAGLSILHEQLGVPVAVTLAAALVSLYWPLVAWLENRKVLRRGRESAAAVFRFLDRPSDVGQAVGADFLQPLAKQLEFDKVSLRDPTTARVLLHDVSFVIPAKQCVALTGPDDLEKHALVYLVPRFLDPTGGEIRIDGNNVRWVTLDSLRGQIAMVLQHNLVFHDTVANNIGCGDSAYSLPRIIEAAKTTHAHHFIQKLPRGYDTLIGELGYALDIGEMFRIALARAALHDPALLIIEEPAALLDEDVKALIDDAYARLLPGRTTIFLPHRRSTIKRCDQVLLLYKGRLEGMGEHRELLANNPLYRHLHYVEFSEPPENSG